MNAAVQPLYPLRFPLAGSHLIEASAGTGKTFTIAMLYVRLILQHGGDRAFARALNPPEILVVTFTEAATKELRDRIRQRLADAAALFRDDPAEAPADAGDDPLHELRAGYPAAEWPRHARQLELAAEWMDEAAVSTIHGWCNRMLREHAFDSRSLFSQKLETDQSELRSEVVRDYWRRFYYPLSLAAAARIKACWKTPAELEAACKLLIEHADRLAEHPTPAEIIDANSNQRQRALTALKKPWAAWADEFLDIITEAAKARRFNASKLKPAVCKTWLETIRNWANSDQENLELTKAALERLSPQGIGEAWNDGTPPDHPLLHELRGLKNQLAALPEPGVALLAHAARWIAREFDAARKRRAQIGFNDLLTGLDSALSGPGGARLAETIRRQFPVAMIDEFQDTDPIQYRIFERIYELSANRQDSALILIGDPKQAIYAFRGADIHTYLKACRDVAGRLYSLDTNYRSTEGMVQATNHCFDHVERQAGSPGAFLFRDADGNNAVPFLKVAARGRKERFEVAGKLPEAMTLAILDDEGEISKTRYISRMAEICATQIVHWLNTGAAGTAGFAPPGGSLRALRPGDIAVLVNNGDEARNIRQSLSRRGVRSVYLSDKDTVYATRQASEVYRWLAACAEPDNDRLLRAALATPSLGLSFADLDQLNVDEYAWESRVIQFKGYRGIWQKQGVLPMIRRILFDFGCSDRLLHLESDARGQSGERILTDLLHLAELLQQASFRLEGEHALTRFLAEQIAQPGGEAEGRKLRLESDENLVQVVTIHKSKGLEYPIVCLPFICATRLTKDSDVPIKWHDSDGELRISLAATPEIVAGAERDRLGEDLRKLYVALTRAKYQTWIGLAAICDKQGKRWFNASAIGHCLGLKDLEPGRLAGAVRAFASTSRDIAVSDQLLTDNARFAGQAGARAAAAAWKPVHHPRRYWRFHSYSGLLLEGIGKSLPASLDDSAETDNIVEGQQEAAAAAASPRPAPAVRGRSIHHFPKGADAGTFLHGLMEWVANGGFGNALQNPDLLREQVARRCQTQAWEKWEDLLIDWVEQMLTTPLPLPGGSLRLDTVKVARAEMEFWFQTSDVDLVALDAAVRAATLDGRERPELKANTLNGMLKGFMDLVFEHDGRYYVADYKSNWLGDGAEAYTGEAMDAAIREKRYDLQYVIYLFALHRLLKSRLPDYDYERHVGGALYLFLRGIAAPSAGVHFERPPASLIATLERIFTGQRGGEA